MAVNVLIDKDTLDRLQAVVEATAEATAILDGPGVSAGPATKEAIKILRRALESVRTKESDPVRLALKNLLSFKADESQDWERVFNWLDRGYGKEKPFGMYMYTKGDGDAPFFSETFLYNLLGKEEARTLRAYLHHLVDALAPRRRTRLAR